MQSQSQWYLGTKGTRCSSSAEQAFKEASAVFLLDPQNQGKSDRVQHLQSLADLQCIVLGAQSKYEQQHQDDKVRKWLSKFSSRITYYGRVLDVLVQHHPEYVSLAWGAMKLLFLLVENHGKQVKTLAKGLTQIADVLPRIELANILYPTARMQKTVSELYSHIIAFFLRAERWYQQGKLRHAWEAFSRPVELHYNDLIGEIEDCTKDIETLANAGAQAEQRDMHLEIQDLGERLKSSEALLEEVRGMLISYQSVQASAHLDTSQRLTDLQLNQIMDYLSGASASDPLKILQYRTFMSARARSRQRNIETEPKFWANPKFYAWESASSPSLIMVKGDYMSRLQVQNFTVEVIAMLRDQKVPTLWALKSVSASRSSAASVTDVIKGLVSQAIQLNISLHTESSLALSCAQFRAAETPEQWFDLLARVIADLPQLYIIIDMEAVGNAYSHGFSWLVELSAMFQRQMPRKWISRLKVLLTSYGSVGAQRADMSQFRDVIVSAKQTVPTPALKRATLPLHLQKSGQMRAIRGISRGGRLPLTG